MYVCFILCWYWVLYFYYSQVFAPINYNKYIHRTCTVFGMNVKTTLLTYSLELREGRYSIWYVVRMIHSMWTCVCFLFSPSAPGNSITYMSLDHVSKSASLPGNRAIYQCHVIHDVLLWGRWPLSLFLNMVEILLHTDLWLRIILRHMATNLLFSHLNIRNILEKSELITFICWSCVKSDIAYGLLYVWYMACGLQHVHREKSHISIFHVLV